MLPTISIITVCFNSVKTIQDTLNSVLNQDYPNIDYIVVDGGSTDGTMEILISYQHSAIKSQIESFAVPNINGTNINSGYLKLSNDRFKFISEPDLGLYDALNKGIKMTIGEVVGFLHSDDYFTNNSVISEIAHKFKDSNINGVYGDLQYVDNSSGNEKVVRHWCSGAFKREALKWGWLPPHPTLYLHRSVYEKIGGFELSYKISADTDYMLRVLSKKHLNFAYIPEVLVKMRVGGTSRPSFSNQWRKWLEDYRIYKNNSIGGVISVFCKNVRKFRQFYNY